MRLALRLGSFALVALAVSARAQSGGIPVDTYRQLHWRTIGPEGNRFTSAAGIPGDALAYYVGAASGAQHRH